jgi:hypothetical protein
MAESEIVGMIGDTPGFFLFFRFNPQLEWTHAEVVRGNAAGYRTIST